MSEGSWARRSVCPLCEAMCGIVAQGEGDRVTSVRGDPDDPLSRGAICPKAAALPDIHADPDRVRTPLRRTAQGFEPCSWEEALSAIASGVLRLQAEHGRDSVGLYLGNPTVHNLGLMLYGPVLWRALGSRNRYSATSVDQLPHLLVSHLMFGHQLLVPIPDVDHADLFVVFGANPLVSNGSMMSAPGMRKRLDALRQRGGRLVVFDPRRTETAARADEHHFIRPGSDAALLASMIHVLFAELAPRPSHLPLDPAEIEALRQAVADLSPERTAPFTGVPPEVVRRLTREVHASKSVLYPRFGACTQAFGTLTVWLSVALSALCGRLDARGGLLFTEPAFDALYPPFGRGLSPGHFDRYRSRVAGLPEFAGELPVAGLADEILTPGQGQVRGLIVWAGNPVLSTPSGHKLEEAISKLDLCVSVDLTINETSRHAHYLLPAAPPLSRPHYDIAFHLLSVRNTAKWSDPVVAADGETRHDWQIAHELAARLLRGRGAPLSARLQHRMLGLLGPERTIALGLRLGPRKVSLRALRSSSGLDFGPLEPCLTRRMPERAKLCLAPAPLLRDLDRVRAALAEPSAPLVLVGRRELRSCNSWLHNSPRLVKGDPRCVLLIHPSDAARAGLVDGALARLTSRAGSVEVPISITEDISPGVVSLPHGYGHAREGVRLSVARSVAGVSVNDVTDAQRLDTLSGNAAFSGTPVEVRPALG